MTTATATKSPAKVENNGQQEQQPTAAIAKFASDTKWSPAICREYFLLRLPDLMKLYPRHMSNTAARLAQSVISEYIRNENLWQCTGMSLFRCAEQAAVLNLEIGGVLGHSYLVPYNNSKKLPDGLKEAQFQLGYKGLIVLAHRTGQLRGTPRPVSVRHGETIKIMQGSDAKIVHEPIEHASVDPQGKDITHVYVTLKYKNGGEDFEVMSRDQIEKHRFKYSKMPNSPAWKDAWEAMAWKTVIRKLLKRCPMSIDMPLDLDAGEADEPLMIEEPKSAGSQNRLPPRQVSGEVSSAPAGEVTVADLEAAVQAVIQKEMPGGGPEEYAETEFQACDAVGARYFGELTPEQRATVYTALEKRAGK